MGKQKKMKTFFEEFQGTKAKKRLVKVKSIRKNFQQRKIELFLQRLRCRSAKYVFVDA